MDAKINAFAYQKTLIKILHVEDSRSDCVLIRGMLNNIKGHDFQLTTVASVEKAQEEIEKNPYDIILLDLHVEDSFGIGTLETVHAAAPKIPIVITTGTDNNTLIHVALRKGAQDYLVKGKIGADLLNRTICNAIDRKAAETSSNEKSFILTTVMDAAQLGYWDWNIKDNSEHLSPELCQLFGYVTEELNHSPNAWHKLVHPDDLPKLLDAFKAHINSKGTRAYNIEIRIKHKRGYFLNMICRGKVIEWDDSTNANRMVGCFINNTAA